MSCSMAQSNLKINSKTHRGQAKIVGTFVTQKSPPDSFLLVLNPASLFVFDLSLLFHLVLFPVQLSSNTYTSQLPGLLLSSLPLLLSLLYALLLSLYCCTIFLLFSFKPPSPFILSLYIPTLPSHFWSSLTHSISPSYRPSLFPLCILCSMLTPLFAICFRHHSWLLLSSSIPSSPVMKHCYCCSAPNKCQSESFEGRPFCLFPLDALTPSHTVPRMLTVRSITAPEAKLQKHFKMLISRGCQLLQALTLAVY